jgi:Flp pilus assembly protein TadG
VRISPSSRLRRFTARFARTERGATAVEFALVSLPILVMIFGLLELALVFMVGTTLDSATEAAARQIRTGQFQSGQITTMAAFKTLVCQRMTWLTSKCDAQLSLDVRTFQNFSDMAAVGPVNPITFGSTQPCFSPGQPGDKVLVRTYFTWNLFTPLLDAPLENMGPGSGRRLLSSTTAFMNEPYNPNSPQGASVCP